MNQEHAKHYVSFRPHVLFNPDDGSEISRTLYAYSNIDLSQDGGRAHTDGAFIGEQDSIVVFHGAGVCGLPAYRTRRDGKTEIHRRPADIFEILIATSLVPPQPEKPLSIYFVEDPASGHIKIGVTKDLKTRLSRLHTGTSRNFRLLGSITGPRSLEKELHEKFASARVRREWFHPTPALLEYIRANATTPA
jgi:hypothetical protein